MKPRAGSSEWEVQGRGCMLGAQCQPVGSGLEEADVPGASPL